MARRRRKDPVSPKPLIGLFLALCFIWLFVRLFLQPALLEFSILLVAAVLACPLIWYLLRASGRDALFRDVDAVVNQHLDALVRRRMQLVWNDPYGKPQAGRWLKEIDYFLTQHVEPTLSGRRLASFRRVRAECARLIAHRVEAAIVGQPAFQAFSDEMTPAEFEGFCAEELRREGWNARVTMQSRDQGVDVVAEKGSVRIVLQCKLYARPVGNKAVQEAAAARAFEQANYGAVVSNNSYTSAAQQLASSNQILLLHYRDLRNLDNLLGVSAGSASPGHSA